MRLLLITCFVLPVAVTDQESRPEASVTEEEIQILQQELDI